MSKVMHAIVIPEVGKAEVREYPMPACDPDKLLIKNEYCALCTYEQRVFNGVHHDPLPIIGGHEVSGTIVEVGEELKGKGWEPGQKVVYGVTHPCGVCYHCRNGNAQACVNFTNRKILPGQSIIGSGGLAEYAMGNPHSVFKYYDVSAEEASLIEPVSCVVHSVESVNPQLGDYVVIIGAGIMGLLHTELCVHKGACVIVVDMNTERLEHAKKIGAKHVIDPSHENTKEKILEYTRGLGADAVFDTTPIASVAEECVDYLGQMGKLMIYSGIYPDHPISVSPHKIHKKAISIMGSANSNEHDFITASKLVSEGIIDVKQFISGIYEAKDCQKAFEEAPGKFRNIIHLNFED